MEMLGGIMEQWGYGGGGGGGGFPDETLVIVFSCILTPAIRKRLGTVIEKLRCFATVKLRWIQQQGVKGGH